MCPTHHGPRETKGDSLERSRRLVSGRFAEAFSLALKLHGSQTRKQAKHEQGGPGIPYVAHLMSVAALVLEHGGDEDEAIAALLHDGPEDQGGEDTLDEIRLQFGDRVAGIVAGCSDTFETPKPEWRARKGRYLERLREADSESVFLVSVADKVHNLRSILADYRSVGEKLWDRFTGKRDGTLWYYRELLRVYQEKAPTRCAALVEEMERVFRELLDAKTRSKAATHEKIEIPDEHREYLRRRDFKPLCDPAIFSAEEQKYLKRWGHWLQALADGRIEPLTEPERSFVTSVRSDSLPGEPFARLWWKYLQRLTWEHENRGTPRYVWRDPGEVWLPRGASLSPYPHTGGKKFFSRR